MADELEGGDARRAGARGLRRGSDRAAGVLCGRSWRGGAARLHRGRRCAAPLTIDCLRLRDVGGGEIDQPTALVGALTHRVTGAPGGVLTCVSAHTCAHAHRELKRHTAHARPQGSAGNGGQERRRTSFEEAYPGSLLALTYPLPPSWQRELFVRARRSGARHPPPGARTGLGPAALAPAAAATVGTRLPSATRARARRCSPRHDPGRTWWPESEKLPAA